MMKPKTIPMRLADVQETLLLPLWGRAVEARKKKPILVNAKAVEIVERLNYDFSIISHAVSPPSQMSWTARCLVFDGIVRRFLERHPHGTVVNIGCGLDTAFERVDNGSVRWFDLDLPDVFALRRQLLDEHPRRTHLAQSFLETNWFDSPGKPARIPFISAGILYYFTENVIRDFIKRIADGFPDSEIAFDATSNMWFSNAFVLKKGKFNALLAWGLKHPAVLAAWDERITVSEIIPMFHGLRNKLPFFTRLATTLVDGLKMLYVVRLAFKG